MLFRILLLVCFCSLFAQKWQTAKTGLKYKIIKDVKGPKAAFGDEVSVYFNFLNFKDSLLSTNVGEEPMKMKLEKSYKGSLEEGMTMMSVGDSMIFEIPSDSLGFPERPPFIPKGSSVFFRIKMVKIEKAPETKKTKSPKKKKHKKFKKLPSGIEYVAIKDVEGQKVEKGGMVMLELNYTNEKESFNSLKENRGQPLQLLIPDTLQPHTFMEALVLFSQNDSLLIQMNSDSLYKNIFGQPVPPGLPKGSKTLFEIKVVNVLSKDSVTILRNQYLAEQQKAKEQLHMQYQKDTLLIVEYLKKNNLIAKRTQDGVYYTVHLSKPGITLQPGDTANTFYAGRLLDGEQFDANFNATAKEYQEPFPVVVGETQVIRGWHSALMSLKKGEKATVYIPSILGYGPDGAGERIPPNAVLVFDIEIKE